MSSNLARNLLACSESIFSWNIPLTSSDKGAPEPLWKAKTSQSVQVSRQFEVVWAPQNVSFASVGEDGRVTFNRPNGDYLGSLTGVTTPLYSLDIHPKSRLLVTGGEDTMIRVWDLKEKKVALTFKSHEASVVSVRFCPDEDHLATASVDGILLVHNLRNGKTVTKLQVRGEDASDAIKSIQYSPFERSRLATCTDRGKIHVWETSRAKILASISAHIAPCSSIAYSKINATLLASASLDKTVKLHDTRLRKTVSTIQLDSPATAIDFAADGSTIAVGTSNGNILIYDLHKGVSPVFTLEVPNGSQNGVECLRFQSNASPNTSIKTPRNSSKQSLKTEDFFAASPNAANVNIEQHPFSSVAETSPRQPSITPRDSLVSNSSSSAMDLFSPIRVSDVAPSQVSQSPLNMSLSSLQIQNSQTPLALQPNTIDNKLMPPSSSIPLFSNLMSPIAPLNSNEITSSGIPLSLLSPGPNTPSSYKYSSHRDITNNIFSPQVSGNITSTPTKSPTTLPTTFSSSSLFSPATNSHFDANMPNHSPRHVESKEPVTPIISRTNSISAMSTPSHSFSGFPDQNSNFSSTPLQYSFSSFQGESGSAKGPRSASPDSPTLPNKDSAVASHEQFQWQLVQNVLSNMMDGFRSDVQNQLQNLHLEMIRQFQMQQEEIEALMKQYDTNKQLLDIIKDLREENEKLRKLY